MHRRPGSAQNEGAGSIGGLPTQRLFDLDFVTGAGIEEIVDALLADDDQRRWRCVVTPNVDHLVRYRRYRDEAATAERATVVLPDGMPIVWASRLLGRPLTARLPGSELFAQMWPRLVSAQVPLVVVASDDEVAAGLTAEHAAIRCIVPPLFSVDDDATVSALLDEIDAAVAELTAQFVVVGVSMPKHHLIARKLEQRWAEADGRPTVMLLGTAPSFVLGLVKRAPEWMQRTGLEWFYRLAGEPRRLAKRYLVDDLAFVPIVWREWRSQRARR